MIVFVVYYVINEFQDSEKFPDDKKRKICTAKIYVNFTWFTTLKERDLYKQLRHEKSDASLLILEIS